MAVILRDKRKAVVALLLGMVIAGLTAIQSALADGAISTLEWVVIALAVVGVPGAVYEVRNDPVE